MPGRRWPDVVDLPWPVPGLPLHRGAQSPLRQQPPQPGSSTTRWRPTSPRTTCWPCTAGRRSWASARSSIRGDYRMLEWLELYRRAGGRMNVIGQTASEMHDVFANIRILAAAGVAAIYHHGTATDKFWQAGRIDDCLPYLKCMRDCGVAVGLATHIPEVIEHAEEQRLGRRLLPGQPLQHLARAAGIAHRHRRRRRLRPRAVPGRGPPADARDHPRDAQAGAGVQGSRRRAAVRLTPTACRPRSWTPTRTSSPPTASSSGLFPKHFDQVQVDLEHAEHACRATVARSAPDRSGPRARVAVGAEELHGLLAAGLGTRMVQVGRGGVTQRRHRDDLHRLGRRPAAT